MKYDFFEVIQSEGYEEARENGWVVFRREYPKSVEVEVTTNEAHGFIEVVYYRRGKAFKSKRYTSGKRAYNAIRETLEWNELIH